MPTTIDQLDDLSLLRIFDELSIDDLFCAGYVCVWWNGIRSKSANGRKELNLLVGRNSHICERYIQDSAFRIPEKVKLVNENGDAVISSSEKNLLQSDAPFKVQFPSFGIVEFLFNNLPNLTTLTISCHIEDNQIGFVISLLKLYASTGQLQTLKLFTNSMNHPLLNTLNSIKSLKKLQLNFQFGNSAVKIDLPILGQLEEFDFFKSWLDNFSLDGLRNSLLLYGVQNPKLKNIRIDCPVNDFKWMLSLPRQFASRFTHLHIDLKEPFVNRGLAAILRGNPVQVPFVRRLEEMCRHFHNLTSLKLTKFSRGYPLSPTELFTSLSHLHNLLSLTIDTTVMESIPPVTEVLNKNIPTLPSVRMLTFKIEKLYNEKRDHEKFSNLNLHHYFPNVETVRFTRWAESECRNCRVECNLKFDRFSKLPVGFFLMFCTLRLTKNLTKCQQLKSVCAKLGDSYLEWSIQEINDYKENEIDYFSSEIKQFLNSSENKDKDMFDFELMKNLDSDSVRSEYDDVAGTWYKKVDD